MIQVYSKFDEAFLKLCLNHGKETRTITKCLKYCLKINIDYYL